MAGHYIIAIDLGGTNLKCALLDSALKVKARSCFSTKSFNDRDKLIRGIVDSIETFIRGLKISRKSVIGVGIGVPGPVDASKGLVHFLPNIPGWRDVYLKPAVQRKTGFPVFVDNDAKLMTLAEHLSGAAKGYKNALCITLGTGVGGGLIIDGKLYRGLDNAAGELGHIPVNENGPECGCGSRACLEAYVGNFSIIREARKLFGPGITLEKTSSLARSGDKKAVLLWGGVGNKLGLVLSGIVNLLNLDVIVIGGGVSSAGGVLFSSIRKTIAERAMSVQAKRVQVLKARFAGDAGIIGAGYLVKERLNK